MKKLPPFILLAVLLLPACAGTPTPPQPAAIPTVRSHPTPSTSELEITDPKKTIEVMAGNEFTITVKTFIDPNYHWEVAEELDSKIVDFVWKDHIPDRPDNPNSSGRDVWRFRTVDPGTTTITLGYYEGMTLNANPIRVFTIVVK